MAEGTSQPGTMLFGHRTYRDLVGWWLANPEPVLLAGGAVDTVARLKAEETANIWIIGSGELVRALHAAAPVDEFVLLIHPIVMGSGQRLFGDAERRDLELEHFAVSTTGVLVARYSVRR